MNDQKKITEARDRIKSAYIFLFEGSAGKKWSERLKELQLLFPASKTCLL